MRFQPGKTLLVFESWVDSLLSQRMDAISRDANGYSASSGISEASEIADAPLRVYETCILLQRRERDKKLSIKEESPKA